VCNSLAPAEISRVIIDEDNRSMEVIVPDEFLSIAIGKKGQNVRLASKLAGWHLDVKSETLYSEAMKSGYESLVALPGIGVSMADALYEKGLFSAEEISNVSVEDLTQIRGIGEGKAEKLIAAATHLVNTAAEKDETEDETEDEAENVIKDEAEDVVEDEAEDATEDKPDNNET